MKRSGRLLMTTGSMALLSALAFTQVPTAMAQSAPGWGWQDRDHDRYDHDRNWHGNRDDFRGGLGVARHFGYEDGFNDGAYDRRTGHSFRPTHSRNFKHADRGYKRRFVSRHEYKEVYRNAYEEGYRRGYRTGGWRR